MYRATTRGVRVTVEPAFVAEESDPARGRWFWSYAVEIANLGEDTVRLLARHWRITDATGRVQEVRGPGVVGEQPSLDPGEAFRYISGCPLETPGGVMAGTYLMVTSEGESFEATIPAFSLDAPGVKRTLN